MNLRIAGLDDVVALRPFHDGESRGLRHQKECRTHVVGAGLIEPTSAGVRVVREICDSQIYSNAQFDDYQQLPRNELAWTPPLTLTIRARFSHPSESLIGTAGFGLWNNPFMSMGARTPSLPKAIWFFFSSPPSNMALAQGIPGYGWKAATIDAQQLGFYCLIPTAPIAIPLMFVDSIYRRLWPLAQRAIGVDEAEIAADMTQWHTYTLTWRFDSAEFLVDDACILQTKRAPHGRLGLVVWIDNQFMVVTPQGKVRHGLLESGTRQWMELSFLQISNG